jgi:hypothetical protein
MAGELGEEAFNRIELGCRHAGAGEHAPMPGRDQRNRKQRPITVSAVNPWRMAFWEELFAVLRSRSRRHSPEMLFSRPYYSGTSRHILSGYSA